MPFPRNADRAKCINTTSTNRVKSCLELNRVYDVVDLDRWGTKIRVALDKGASVWYDSERFVPITKED